MPSIFRPVLAWVKHYVRDELQKRGIGSLFVGAESVRGTLPTAVQQTIVAANLTSGAATDGHVLTADGSGGSAWEAAAGGAVDAGDVTYTPTTAADWDGSADPGDVDAALDQLAERVTDVEGGAIADHAHAGVAGDGGTFDGTNLTSGLATDGHVLTADGSGGAAWEAPPAGGAVDADDVTYTPTTATDWDSDADPGSTMDALDQLAERVDDLEGAPSGGADLLEVQVFS